MANFITLNQLRKSVQSLLIKINDNKDYLDNKVNLKANKFEVPTLEPMTNVNTMLTSFGLSSAGNLQPATSGTTETGTAVVQ